MLVLIFILSAVFFGLGFLITEKNAPYLLSGYNTMSVKEKENFDLKAYLILFKKFHIYLGLSMLVLSSLIYFFIDVDFSFLFLVVYILFAYVYLFWKGNEFYLEKKKNKQMYLGIVVLIITAVVVLFLFTKTLKNNEIIISRNSIEITEEYGMTIKIDEIKNIKLVNQLPKISTKINGSALEIIKKGNFKLQNGEKVKLFINSDNTPIILFTTTEKYKIYYSSKDKSNDSIFKELIKVIKN